MTMMPHGSAGPNSGTKSRTLIRICRVRKERDIKVGLEEEEKHRLKLLVLAILKAC